MNLKSMIAKLYDSMFSKNRENEEIKQELVSGVSEKVKRIVELLKERTATTAYKLTILDEKEPELFESKFGGVPYWDLKKEYPVDSKGEKLQLLAQINFTAAKLQDDRLPEQGMLQFFISADDDCYGMDWDQGDSQKDFRVIYHEEIDTTVTKEQVLALEIPYAAGGNNEFTPVLKEVSLEITKQVTSFGTEDYRFDEVLKNVIKEVTGEETELIYSFFSEEEQEYIFRECENGGHWLLGSPFFTQGDPRGNGRYEEYDTLLFQMDSECKEGNYTIIWGDAGVGNFFINEQALKNKDFSKVLYNWDCY